MLERTGEDGHFGNETAESGQSQIGKTGDYIADSQKRHNLHQTGEFADVTRMGTSVYHTDKGEEQGCHQSVREHLQNSTRASCLVHHQDGEQHQAAMADGRVGIDILQVGLYTSGECAVYHGDSGKNQEYPSQFLCSFGHQVHGYAETSVTSQFHQYTGMEHGYGSRCGGVTVGAPCVEREQSAQHTETEEGEREPDTLLFDGNIVHLCYFQ